MINNKKIHSWLILQYMPSWNRTMGSPDQRIKPLQLLSSSKSESISVTLNHLAIKTEKRPSQNKTIEKWSKINRLFFRSMAGNKN